MQIKPKQSHTEHSPTTIQTFEVRGSYCKVQLSMKRLKQVGASWEILKQDRGIYLINYLCSKLNNFCNNSNQKKSCHLSQTTVCIPPCRWRCCQKEKRHPRTKTDQMLSKWSQPFYHQLTKQVPDKPSARQTRDKEAPSGKATARQGDHQARRPSDELLKKDNTMSNSFNLNKPNSRQSWQCKSSSHWTTPCTTWSWPCHIQSCWWITRTATQTGQSVKLTCAVHLKPLQLGQSSCILCQYGRCPYKDSCGPHDLHMFTGNKTLSSSGDPHLTMEPRSPSRISPFHNFEPHHFLSSDSDDDIL